MKKTKNQSGQVLLMILLVMVVGLTMGLSMATRSTTDIKISNQLEESSKAFSAAEAGIESALKGEGSGSQQLGEATYHFQKASDPEKASIGPVDLTVGETYTVWLTGHDASGNPDISEASDYDGTRIYACWEQTTGTTKPALELTLIYKDGSAYKLTRSTSDPDNSRRTQNHFDDAAAGGSCGAHAVSIIPPAGKILVMLRIRPFYAPTRLVVNAEGDTFPSQGTTITSSGKSGDMTRKIVVTQTFPVPPPIFDYVLYSGGSLTK